MTEETVNLGVLFREKIKGQPYKKPQKKYKSEKSGMKGILMSPRRTYKQGYCFVYIYYDENHKQKRIARKTLKDLYNTIKDIGGEIIVTDIKKARNFIDKYGGDEEFKFFLK